jgi:ABC-type glutathione transport system ATPase component
LDRRVILASRTDRREKLRKRVAESAKRTGPSLIGRRLTEAGLLDRAVLNQEIEAILQDGVGDISPAEVIEDRMEQLVLAARKGEVAKAAQHVITLLSLNLDGLRKAALLSLMVRLSGKRKFDPVAAYILEKRGTYVTGQG